MGSCPTRNAKSKACTSLAIPKLVNKMSNDISRALTLPSSDWHQLQMIPFHVNLRVSDEPVGAKLKEVLPKLGVPVDGIAVDEQPGARREFVAQNCGGFPRTREGRRVGRGGKALAPPSRSPEGMTNWGYQPRYRSSPCPPLRRVLPAASSYNVGVV